MKSAMTVVATGMGNKVLAAAIGLSMLVGWGIGHGEERDDALPPLPVGDTLAAQPQVMVKAIRVVGATVLPEAVLAEMVQPLIGREVPVQALLALRDRLTAWYIAEGYVTSGVVLPDQTVTDGEVVLEAVEGVLSEVLVRGNQTLNQAYIAGRLEAGAKVPLKVVDLEERFQLLRQGGLVQNLNSRLRPGLRRGEAILDVEVEESPPYFLGVSYGNAYSPSLGEYKAEVEAGLRSLLGWGDRIALRVGEASGGRDYGVSYELPVTVQDTVLRLNLARTTSTVVTEPFASLDIVSRTESRGVSLRHPLIKRSSEELAVVLGLARRESKTYLLGEPFDYSESTVNGRSVVSVVSLGQEWTLRGSNRVVAVTSELTRGVGCCGATGIAREPDGRFLAWLGQAQWVQGVGFLDSQVLLKGAVRLTNNRMMVTEKFPIGGLATVRGYRENLVTRDQGGVGSLEWRVPAPFRLPVPWIGENEGQGGITGMVFYDYGRGWDRGVKWQDPRDLSSLGVGVQWAISKNSRAEFYYAEGLRAVSESVDRGLQDRGGHFLINLALD